MLSYPRHLARSPLSTAALANFAPRAVWLCTGFSSQEYCQCSTRKAVLAICFCTRLCLGRLRGTDCSFWSLFSQVQLVFEGVRGLSRSVSPSRTLITYAVSRYSCVLHSVTLTCIANLIGSRGERVIFMYFDIKVHLGYTKRANRAMDCPNGACNYSFVQNFAKIL